MKRSTPKSRTKSDLAAYAADLEVEIAYLERHKAELRERLDEALDVIQALAEDQHEVTYLVTDRFSQPHPGCVC